MKWVAAFGFLALGLVSCQTPENPKNVGFSKSLILDLNKIEFSEVNLDIFGARIDVVRVTGAQTSPQLEVHLTGASEAKVNEFSKSIRVSTTNGSLNLAVGKMSCSIQKINGVTTSIKGVCIDKIVVRVPAVSNVSVFDNHLPLLLNGPMPVERLVTALQEQSFDDRRRKIIRKFADNREQHQQRISASELATVVPQFTFDADRLDAVRVLGPFVRAETINSTSIQSVSAHFSFDSDASKCSRYLSTLRRS